MRRKLQVVLGEDAWSMLDTSVKEANDGFKAGHISMSDVVNEMILNAKIDIRLLQAKHTSIRRSLRILSLQDDIDIDTAIRSLVELKSRSTKRPGKATQVAEDSGT